MTEPLVLLPGLGSDARVFWPQIVELSRERQVTVAPTATGERVEEIASDILTTAPAKFALCGHSFGGIVALEVLRRAPERVTRIALMDTTPLASTPQESAEREPRIVMARSRRLEDVVQEELAYGWKTPSTMRNEVVAAMLEMARDLGPEAYVRQARALQRRKDQQATLRRIKQPTLVICGEHDGMTPVRRHEFMAELIPYAEFKMIHDAGHFPTLEQPEATTAALQSWLQQPLVLR